MKYLLSLFAGSAYSPHASGKNYGGIIALLRKNNTKGNDFRASLQEASNGRVGYVTSMIDSAATAYGGSDINSAYRVRSMLGTASTMWLMRVLKGDVLRTDAPPPEMKQDVCMLIIEAMQTRIPSLKLDEDQKKIVQRAVDRLNAIAKREESVSMPTDPGPVNTQTSSRVQLVSTSERKLTLTRMSGLI